MFVNRQLLESQKKVSLKEIFLKKKKETVSVTPFLRFSAEKIQMNLKKKMMLRD